VWVGCGQSRGQCRPSGAFGEGVFSRSAENIRAQIESQSNAAPERIPPSGEIRGETDDDKRQPLIVYPNPDRRFVANKSTPICAAGNPNCGFPRQCFFLSCDAIARC
jgi:hypothetical protein